MFVIGTAGHVDHGKSLLVEALTGIDPDRLREEKARGMTIDLGFAWLTVPSGRSVSIVDVPGHERFIKNMLAGVGGIDLALLVVAADDGVMPQTREHLAILDLLDVRRAVVALTKSDLADDDWLALIEGDIAETLDQTTLAGSPVVRCSALTGAGLDDLRRVLDSTIDDLPAKRDVGRPRLPIDRVFTMAGFGTVVTGTLIDGQLAVGDDVEVVPGGRRARIRGLQSHRDSVERAPPGTRTAVNLAGIAKDDLRRGMVLTKPGSTGAASVVNVRLRAVASLAHPIRRNMRVTFHTGADEAEAQVRLLDADELRAGESAWAQIRLDKAIAVAMRDRFVVRTPNDTIGGGVIVDTASKRHRRRDQGVLERLETMLSADPVELVRAAIERTPFVRRRRISAETSLDDASIDHAVAGLVENGRVASVLAGGDERFATAAYLMDVERRAVEAVDGYHRARALRRGMPLQELRERLRLDIDVFDAIAARWSEMRVGEGCARLAAFTPTPDASQRAQIDVLLASLRNGGSASAVEPELMAYLIERGEIVDASGLLFEGAAFERMAATVHDRMAASGAITLGEVRDLLGVGRKQAQALLEEMDRRRITRRTGDARVLR